MESSNPPTISTPRQILILGASYAGISVAHHLLKHTIPHLPPSKYQITLISTTTQALCRPACPRALISDSFFNQDKLFVDVPRLFKQYPVRQFRFIQGTAISLEYRETRRMSVELAGQNGVVEEIEYYALIVATGASTQSPLLGYTRDENHLRSSWTAFREAMPNAKSILIAGGGPAGIETAGELGEYLNGRAGWFTSKLENPKVSITVVTSDSKILPVLRPALAGKTEKLLEKVGVTVRKHARVNRVVPEGAGTMNVAGKTTVTLEDGEAIEADLYIPAMGTKPNTSFVPGEWLAPDKRIDVNPSTLRVDRAGQHIYAIGDVANYSRPGIHLMLNAIPVVGANIKRDLLIAEGKTLVGDDRSYKEDTRETHLVPVGQSKGAGAMMGYQVPSFLVWLIKGRDYWLWTTGGLWSGKQ